MLPSGRWTWSPPNEPAKITRFARAKGYLRTSVAHARKTQRGIRGHSLRKAHLSRSRKERRQLTGRGFSGGGGRALYRLCNIRTFSSGVGSLPDTHAPVALSISLDETVAQCPDFVVLRGGRNFRTSIGAHHSKIPWSSHVGAACLERVCATNGGVGWGHTFEIGGENRGIGKRVSWEG